MSNALVSELKSNDEKKQKFMKSIEIERFYSIFTENMEYSIFMDIKNG